MCQKISIPALFDDIRNSYKHSLGKIDKSSLSMDFLCLPAWFFLEIVLQNFQTVFAL